MSDKQRPSGKGTIVNWDTGDCYKCNKRFKGRIGLWVHVTRSKNHNKAKIILQNLLTQALIKKKNAQKRLDDFIPIN